jgi:hypothetical protein
VDLLGSLGGELVLLAETYRALACVQQGMGNLKMAQKSRDRAIIIVGWHGKTRAAKPLNGTKLFNGRMIGGAAHSQSAGIGGERNFVIIIQSLWWKWVEINET